MSTPLFDFNDIKPSPLPISPVWGGVTHTVLKKAVWNEPEGKIPRLELHLECQKPGQLLTASAIYIMDWTHGRTEPRYENQPRNEMNRILSIVGAYRPDLTAEQVLDQFKGLRTWGDTCKKLIELLPAEYAATQMTWFLQYVKNMDMLEIALEKDVVRPGIHKFSMNAKYNFMEPNSNGNTPATPAVNHTAFPEPAPAAFF